jgi:Mycothiol-dependent nitroreductase Rv2466c
MTARWVVDEVKPHRDVNITWQPISLLFKNEPPEDSDYFAPVNFTHKMLRVMESVRAGATTPEEGNEAVFKLYWELGSRIHHDRDRDFTAADALEAVGLDVSHASAFDDESWDTTIRTGMDAGLALTGTDVGTPIIAMDNDDGERAAYFGPVINKIPETKAGLAMWDGLVAMMNVDSFFELKRTRTGGLDFPDRPSPV